MPNAANTSSSPSASSPAPARQLEDTPAVTDPGYVPGDSAAGEEDPGASLDMVVERPTSEQVDVHAPDQPAQSAQTAQTAQTAHSAHSAHSAPDRSGAAPAGQVPTLKIDFVSDISCPWCAIGLASLEQALDTLKDEVKALIHVQPFELNPRMAPGGQDIAEHLTQKYGSTPEQQARIRDTIRQRGADVGFTFSPAGRGRIYNTFDAHRLLHWAGGEAAGRQLALKKALLNACHRDRQAMDTHEVLLGAVRDAGLDVDRARAVLEGDAFAEEVRAREGFYTSQGIHSVPAVVIDDRHLISGGQPAAVFAQALREIASERRQAQAR